MSVPRCSHPALEERPKVDRYIRIGCVVVLIATARIALCTRQSLAIHPGQAGQVIG